jgi:P27 family predicted phage terminase small subunit
MGKRGPKSAAELSTIGPVRSASPHKRSKSGGKLPSPPEHLQPSTKVWWNALVADYEFKPHDLQTLQAAAESWDRYQQARQALAEHGLTYVDSKGMIRARPECAIERDSRISYLRALRELHIEPPERPRGPFPWETRGV